MIRKNAEAPGAPEATEHWHVVVGLPGYLPDEHYLVSDRDEAKQCLQDTVSQWLEADWWSCEEGERTVPNISRVYGENYLEVEYDPDPNGLDLPWHIEAYPCSDPECDPEAYGWLAI